VKRKNREDKAMVINGGSGLAALEFADCLLDSPEFRENLNRHEKELDKTSQQIKRIIKEIKDLLNAAKSKLRVRARASDYPSSCDGILHLFVCSK
jgi:GrpB-like predicted nucleotidyltransferase (UPF0157 family)